MEHLDVLVIGAGLSGIGAARHLQNDAPWASFAIVEARDAIGGTWDLFRYPGIRSDSEMFTLGYSFRPWDGKKAIADGASIRQYIEDTATETGVDKAIRFHHRVESAAWSTEEGRWLVRGQRTDTDEAVELTCSFLFSCTGYYRYDRGHLPDFAGMDDFTGRIVHPQFWPEDLDLTGQRVVVIGSGATAVTLVPSLAPMAEHVTMLQRSPTYMGAVPTVNPFAERVRRLLPKRAAAVFLRWFNAIATQFGYHAAQRRPETAKKLIRKGLVEHLPEGYDIDTHFTPRYNPWDQRVCAVADGDLFREIRDGRVDVVTDQIDRFTETGIRLASGAELPADVIVPATGLEMLFLGGIEITVDGEPVHLPDRTIYKGMMLDGVPNLAFAVGYTNASWTLKADLTCAYVCRLLNAMRDRKRRQCTPVDLGPPQEHSNLLDLDAGYIRRAADRVPKSGDRYPWKDHASYLRDVRATRLSSLDDGAMQFTNPAPA